jgi:hypothetical protein
MVLSVSVCQRRSRIARRRPIRPPATLADPSGHRSYDAGIRPRDHHRSRLRLSRVTVREERG